MDLTSLFFITREAEACRICFLSYAGEKTSVKEPLVLFLFFHGAAVPAAEKANYHARPSGFSAFRRYSPVKDPGVAATSSGVPFATTVPPPSPPSGPRSIR